MKALTSFRSKSIVHKLGPSPPRIPLHDRPEFCFNLYSANYNKAPNFCLHKLVQNKGIYPIHVVPSENKVDLELETVEPQDQQSEQTNGSKFVHVAFQLQKGCDFGEQFLIVGDDPMLGLWNPLDALPMTWSDGHIWTVELDMPAGMSIQYKFILKGKEGHIIWQPGSDRIIETSETMNRITVCEDWENADLQTILEEDNLSQPNKEPQLVSEMSTSAEILDNNPQEELESNASNISVIEDTKNHAEGKPVAQPVPQQITGDSIYSSVEKPMAIIADNIGSSEPEDLMESTTRKKNSRNVIQKSEESANGPRNDDIIHDLGSNGHTAAPLNTQEGTIVEASLFNFEGYPVLVPGLILPTEEEAGPGEVQEKTAVDPSNEAFEYRDQNIPENSAMDPSIEAFENQNIPEFSKEQEFSDGTPQEINATLNNESVLHDNERKEQFHLAPAMEDSSNSEPIYGKAFQNDIQWGRETVKKFLTKLGLL